MNLFWHAIIYTNVTNQFPTFEINEKYLYVTVVTLSPQDKAKLLPQLKSCFKEQAAGINMCQNQNY